MKKGPKKQAGKKSPLIQEAKTSSRDLPVIIIVLGCSPYVSEGVLNPELSSRVGRAVELFQRGFGDAILFTGGRVFHEIPESLVMKSLAKMIPKDCVMTEIHAKSTHENAVLTKRILLGKSFRDVILVTSPYHLKRALFVFNKVYGPKFDIVGVPCDYSLPITKRIWRSIEELGKKARDGLFRIKTV